MKSIEVVAGIIFCHNKILCVQRPEGKYDYISFKWEFPGGKIEKNESKEEALKRELLEELDLDVMDISSFMDISYQYPDFILNMSTFVCSVSTNQINRKEHINHTWLYPHEMKSLDWAAADVEIIERIIDTYENVLHKE